MRPAHFLLAVAAMAIPGAALAQPAPVPGEVRLSDAEKEKVLEEAAANNRLPAPAQPIADSDDEDPLPPPIHGEVGFSVGTGGYRSAYGTAVVPLKNQGVAIISLETTDLGSRAPYFGPRWR